MPLKFISLIVLVSITLMTAGCQTKQFSLSSLELEINGQELNLEVAKNTADELKGLSGRESLCENCGMIFIYHDYQVRNFWMKDMNFPLDIIWLKDGLVVGLNKNVPILTDGHVTRLKSPQVVNQVIEVKAGLIDKIGLKPGDKINLD
jgi:uncharacterized membrane protein (UPF0127 family)